MLISPYKLSVFIDADTVVLADPSPLFGLAEKHEFCCTQFSNWVTTGPKVKNRIMAWADLITPEQLDAALNFGAAINSGVLAFKKGSEIIKLGFLLDNVPVKTTDEDRAAGGLLPVFINF